MSRNLYLCSLVRHRVNEDLSNGFFYFSGFACQLPEIHLYDSHLFIKWGSVKRDICATVKVAGFAAGAFYDIESGFMEFVGQSVHPADHGTKIVKAAPLRVE